MPRQGAITCLPGRVALPAVGIPHEELPALSATTTGGQPHPIGAPGHAGDGSMMPQQPQQLRAIRGVPQVDVAIIAPADYPRAIGAPGHATDPGRVRLPDPTAASCCHIPHLQSMLRGSAGQQLPVWTPRHAIEEGVSRVGVPNDLDTGARGRVPEPDGTLPPATGEPAAIRTPSHAVYMPDEGSSLPLPICALPPACCQRPSTARCG